MNLNKIKQKIKDVEEQLENTKIDMVTSEYYRNLLKIHSDLYDFLYFKIHNEKTYLDPPKKEEDKQ